MVKKIFDNILVFIDLMQNFDGCMCFINQYYVIVGMEYSIDCLSVEYNEFWLCGCFNYYLFDMNCDWLVIIQFEIKVCICVINKYKFIVVIDLYEMGGDLSYFFVFVVQFINFYM